MKLQDTLADELGSDLVETSAHSGARPSHAEWQGKVFSRSGTHPKYPDFKKATGYGTGEGLGGWNCRHSFFPYFDGMKQVYTQAELNEMNAKNIEYNGKMYSEYEATQIQRGYERNIRRSKREIAASKAADLPDVEQRAKASLARYQRNQADFIKQTGLKRQYGRENVEGFSRNEAAKARGQEVIARNQREKVAKIQKEEYNKKRAEVLDRIQSGELPLTLNVGNQNKHIRDSKGYIQGRSYIYGDLETAQALVDKHAGSGELYFNRNGNWINKEFITLDENMGVDIDPETGNETHTNRFSIHYGKRGTHIVPAERRKEE